jgi:predicted SprT family Zn-dependent metalloprotease
MKEGFILSRTEKEIIELFNRIAKEEFNYIVDVPVKVNCRLYNSLGRIIFKFINGDIKCIGFDFNKCFLNDDYIKDKIKNTMRHELVHWYTDKQYNENCKHDKRFLENCEKFGVTDFTDFERYKPRKKLNKEQYYEARCCGCDRVVAKAKSINNLKRFMNRCMGTVCSCGNPKRYVMDKGIKRIYCHENTLAPKEFRKQEWFEGDYVEKELKIILCKE